MDNDTLPKIVEPEILHLSHYLHHVIVATIALFGWFLAFGSITVWETMLFIIAAYCPVVDELLYTIIHYLDKPDCRSIVHKFLVGEMKQTLSLLHEKRIAFGQLVIHNIPVYLGLCTLLFISMQFDAALLFYTIAGILTHLIQDLLNDYYEFNSVRKWFWPVAFGLRL